RRAGGLSGTASVPFHQAGGTARRPFPTGFRRSRLRTQYWVLSTPSRALARRVPGKNARRPAGGPGGCTMIVGPAPEAGQMAMTNLRSVLRHLRAAAEAQAARDLGDGELLARFVAGREEAAFTLLVQRHGPMVFSLCRRILGNAPDAEDAFQATFL